jgi:hypothetical protein
MVSGNSVLRWKGNGRHVPVLYYPLGPSDRWPLYGHKSLGRSVEIKRASERDFACAFIGRVYSHAKLIDSGEAHGRAWDENEIPLGSGRSRFAARQLLLRLSSNSEGKETAFVVERSATRHPSDDRKFFVRTGGSDRPLSGLAYREVLSESTFVLCPGNDSLPIAETHSVWEALEAGAVPVLSGRNGQQLDWTDFRDGPGTGIPDLPAQGRGADCPSERSCVDPVKEFSGALGAMPPSSFVGGGCPLPVVDDWASTKAEETVRKLTEMSGAALDELQRRVQAWYRAYMQRKRAQLERAVMLGDYTSEGMSTAQAWQAG